MTVFTNRLKTQRGNRLQRKGRPLTKAEIGLYGNTPIHATDEITIGKYLKLLNLDKAQITKLNKYRELAKNNPIVAK